MAGVPWADYYEVHRNTETAIQSYNTLITTTSEILFEDMTALPATTYYYKVKACNVAGCSELSGGDSGYHVSDAPAVPDTITASDGTYTDTIYVSWSSVPWVDTYEVYRCTSTSTADCGAAITTTDGVTYSDTDVTLGTIYYYRIKTCNIAGCSDLSAYDDGHAELEPDDDYYMFIPLALNN